MLQWSRRDSTTEQLFGCAVIGVLERLDARREVLPHFRPDLIRVRALKVHHAASFAVERTCYVMLYWYSVRNIRDLKKNYTLTLSLEWKPARSVPVMLEDWRSIRLVIVETCANCLGFVVLTLHQRLAGHVVFSLNVAVDSMWFAYK